MCNSILYIPAPRVSHCDWIIHDFLQQGFSIFVPTIVDEMGCVYSVGTALLESEKLVGSYQWVLEQMVAACPEWRDVNITIFTDKGNTIYCTVALLSLSLSPRLW